MTPIFDALACHARQRPEALAFRDGTRVLTWADLAQEVACAAAGFANGPRTVGLRLAGLDYVIADLAATLAGCRVVPVPRFFSFGQHGGDHRQHSRHGRCRDRPRPGAGHALRPVRRAAARPVV